MMRKYHVRFGGGLLEKYLDTRQLASFLPYYTPKGTPASRFSVAVNRTWTNAEGQKQEDTDWFNVEAWGKLGEICQQYLKKGRQLYVEGRLHTDRWEDDKGETQYMTKVIATGMQMLDRKPDEPEGGEVE
jgi:single-strand DNA-binding protein